MANRPGRPVFDGLHFFTAKSGKITIPTGASALAPWWEEGRRVECLAIVSPHRSLAIMQPLELESRFRVARRAAGIEVGQRDLGSRDALLALVAPRFWAVTIGANRQMRVPVDAVNLGVAPGDGQQAALTVAAGVIQLWHRERLEALLAETAGRWAELTGPEEEEEAT